MCTVHAQCNFTANGCMFHWLCWAADCAVVAAAAHCLGAKYRNRSQAVRCFRPTSLSLSLILSCRLSFRLSYERVACSLRLWAHVVSSGWCSIMPRSCTGRTQSNICTSLNSNVRFTAHSGRYSSSFRKCRWKAEAVAYYSSIIWLAARFRAVAVSRFAQFTVPQTIRTQREVHAPECCWGFWCVCFSHSWVVY